MDLADLDVTKAAEEGATLQLRHPVNYTPLETDDGKPITITLCGRDSRRFQKAKAKSDEKAREMARNRGRMLTTDEIDGIASETLAACVMAWDNIRHGSEKPLELTFENAKDLLTKQKWVREQVDGFIADRANFWREPQKA